ncbi:MAG: UDP-N-acetylmuramate--L-alanine ligase [bacterium]|nr:UDP-N-acetylmuramate--L-alanine ligase [bacterium]
MQLASWRLPLLRLVRLYTFTSSTPQKTAYLIGIKGAGMTALAQVYAGRGIRVSGSDTSQRFYTDDVLRRAGISFVEHFATENIPADTDLVVRSTAYDADHVEVAEALRRGLRVLTYPEAIAEVFNAGKGIAICGTHGKSTTTAMLGWVLAEAGLDPTVIVGAEVPQFGGNARIGQSDIVVLEADEYQDKLQYLKPQGVILTSIEYDHPDFFSTPEAYADVFRRFVARIPADGFLVTCVDDGGALEVAKEASCEVIAYGFNNLSQFRTKLRKAPEEITLKIPGRHNIQNALGVLATAEQLGVSRDVALRALASFQGTRRRFETVGEVGGITVIDDYGHHPTEIRVTLAAARERFSSRRILCAFHAHTFTRTIALKDTFATAFVSADRTYVMDIFGSAREQLPHFSPSHREGELEGVGPSRNGSVAHNITSDLVAAIHTNSPATASGNVEQTVEALLRDVRPGDVVICMGAGENDRVARLLVERLRVR